MKRLNSNLKKKQRSKKQPKKRSNMAKKKLEEVVETSSVEETGIAPLALSLDFGREDLNQVFGKLQDKINELIKKQ